MAERITGGDVAPSSSRMTGHERAQTLRRILYRLGEGSWLLGQAHDLLAATALRRPPIPGGGPRRDSRPGAGADAGIYSPTRRGTASLRLAPRANPARGPPPGGVRGPPRGPPAPGGFFP